MTHTNMHDDTARARTHRPRGGLAAAFLCAGAFAAGAALAAFSLVSPGTEVDAGEVNYVRSISHDAVAGVRLDEEVSIRFNAAVLDSSVGPDTILIRTGVTNGEQANGLYIVGKFMYDRTTQRRVVVRPEAVQEYFQLIKGLPRGDARRKARRLIGRLEKTGRFGKLRKIDRQLRDFFGPSFGAGTRLDDENVTGTFPPQLPPNDSLEPYRQLVAGNDADYQAHLEFVANTGGDDQAFARLAANSEFERFFHPIDPATGVPAPDSVLRDREYRRVLINRRNRARVMFVPNLPIKETLEDAGYGIGRSYSATVPASQPGVFNTVLTRAGRRPLRQRSGADFSTLFTTVPGTVSSTNLFLGNEARTGVAALQKPRIINQTPPNGEIFVDGTTDWEDPDNALEVPLPARKTLTVRLRFAQPLDPRTVNPTNFTITKTKTNPGTAGETVVSIPIPVGTFLNQNRLGIVEVEVTPATNLDPQSEYEIVVRGNVRTLGALADGTQATLGQNYRGTIIVGEGPIALDKIKEGFESPGNIADEANTDTLGQQTTAYWPAPPLFDPDATGRLFANFMPALGFGTGAPRDPLNPLPFDPNNQQTFPITDLMLAPGEVITFVTEGLDPADSATFGQQIEYEYRAVEIDTATALVVGRYPLVLRSQTSIVMTSSSVLANGLDGQNGIQNTDTVNGGPTGGTGGDPGSGGYRGGDGAFAPETDADGGLVLDGFGNTQFDAAKFDGQDGYPSHTITGPLTGGAGRGGYSGDQEGATFIDPNTMLPIPDGSPERTREAGGGGGHATIGGNGAAFGGTAKTDTNGIRGGTGGPIYGEGDMGDQPENDLAVPTLSFGTGGAGGGGGGGEDDANALTMVEDTVGPEDAGGGGGGGGGGAVQFVARDEIRIDGGVVNCSGGIGGRTFDAALSAVGEGAPGGSGAGGTIWMQCFGDIIVTNTLVDASGGQGDISNNVGQLHPNNPDTGVVTGVGGLGGDGYIRFEDADGTAVVTGSTVQGVVSEARFEPDINGDYPAHPGLPMVVNESIAYSRWFNSELDTPTYVLLEDDPLTAAIEGTSVFEAPGQTVIIEARSAPGDPARAGRPQSLLATNWTPIDQVTAISDRRFLQFRVQFIIPLSYVPTTVTGTVIIPGDPVPPGDPPNPDTVITLTEQTPRSYVDCIAIAVELQ